VSAYREAFLALLYGERPIALASGDEHIKVIGPLSPRAIILRGEVARYALDWACDVQHSRNRHLAELGRKVFRLCARPAVTTERFENTLIGIGT
jgi:hypothetical protein